MIPARIMRATDVARYFLALSHELWQARNLNTTQTNADELIGLATLASVDLALREKATIEIAGVRLAIGLEAMPLAWMQTVELLREKISTDTLRSLAPDGQLPARGARAYIDLSDEADRAALINGLASSLIREADEHAAFAPAGTFRVFVPDELAVLRESGIDSFVIAADPRGLWVRVYGDGDGGLFRWEPGSGVKQLVIMSGYAAWLNVALAALWHDLRVAGEESFPARERSAQANGFPLKARGNDVARRSHSVRTLPVLRLSGKREWSTPAEREIIKRRAHGVRGFQRRLHDGWTRSAEAEEIAREFGVVLPDGFTFVRPHVRGTEGDVQAEMTVVRSRGLASVMALLSD